MAHLKYPPRTKATPPGGNGVTVKKMTKKEKAAIFGKAKERAKKAEEGVKAAPYDKAGTRVGVWSKKDRDRVKVDADTLASNDGELRGRWLA